MGWAAQDTYAEMDKQIKNGISHRCALCWGGGLGGAGLHVCASCLACKGWAVGAAWRTHGCVGDGLCGRSLLPHWRAAQLLSWPPACTQVQVARQAAVAPAAAGKRLGGKRLPAMCQCAKRGAQLPFLTCAATVTVQFHPLIHEHAPLQ